jgi:hypothetical protein
MDNGNGGYLSHYPEVKNAKVIAFCFGFAPSFTCPLIPFAYDCFAGVFRDGILGIELIALYFCDFGQCPSKCIQ